MRKDFFDGAVKGNGDDTGSLVEQENIVTDSLATLFRLTGNMQHCNLQDPETSEVEVQSIEQKVQQEQLERIKAVLEVESRIERTSDWKSPDDEQVRSDCESIFQNLFTDTKICKAVWVPDEDSESRYSLKFEPMLPKDLEKVIEVAEDKTWGEPCQDRPTHAAYDHFDRKFFFLDSLFTACFDEWKNGTRIPGIYVPALTQRECLAFQNGTDVFEAFVMGDKHRDGEQEFVSFKTLFDKRVEQLMVHYCPEIAVPLTQNETESEYCDCYGLDNTVSDILFGMRLEFDELFIQYLISQDWRRFIDPVRAIVATQDTRTE